MLKYGKKYKQMLFVYPCSDVSLPQNCCSRITVSIICNVFIFEDCESKTQSFFFFALTYCFGDNYHSIWPMYYYIYA